MNIPTFGLANTLYSRVNSQQGSPAQFGMALSLPGRRITRAEADAHSQATDEALERQRQQRGRTERAVERNRDNRMDD